MGYCQAFWVKRDRLFFWTSSTWQNIIWQIYLTNVIWIVLDAYVFYLYETFTSSLFTLTSYFKYGGVAQLGERLTGSQEVMGSIPTVSTKKCKSKDLHFFIHCESNGISSAVRLYIITRSVYIINRRLHKRFRNDDIQRLVPLMICNSNGIDDIHGSAVIFDIVHLVRFALAEHEGHIIG